MPVSVAITPARAEVMTASAKQPSPHERWPDGGPPGSLDHQREHADGGDRMGERRGMHVLEGAGIGVDLRAVDGFQWRRDRLEPAEQQGHADQAQVDGERSHQEVGQVQAGRAHHQEHDDDRKDALGEYLQRYLRVGDAEPDADQWCQCEDQESPEDRLERLAGRVCRKGCDAITTAASDTTTKRHKVANLNPSRFMVSK